MASVSQGPLQGLRVVELGTLIAVLRELGYDEARALRDNGVIA